MVSKTLKQGRSQYWGRAALACPVKFSFNVNILNCKFLVYDLTGTTTDLKLDATPQFLFGTIKY